MKYTYCNVCFEYCRKEYCYLANEEDLREGDLVIVPVGYQNDEVPAVIVGIAEYEEDDVPYPLEHTKTILRKLTQREPQEERENVETVTEPQAEDNGMPEKSVLTEPQVMCDEMSEEPVLNVEKAVPRQQKNNGVFWNKCKNVFKRVAVFFLVAGLIGGGIALGYGYVQKVKAQRAADYQNGIAAIASGDLERGKALLQPLDGLSKYSDIEMILLYADIFTARANNLAIKEQKKLLNSYDRAYKGPFSDEMATLASAIDEEYAIYEEELAAYLKEQEEIQAKKEAEREREYKRKLATGILYEGLSEEYIDCTIVGRHTTKDSSKNDRTKEITNKYCWYAENGKAIVLIVTCRGGKVDSVIKYSTDRYWNADGTPHFSSAIKGSSSGSSSSKKSSYHDSYDDGYNAVYDDGDYDWDRYYRDDDYASGVDDALDDWDDYGEDW